MRHLLEDPLRTTEAIEHIRTGGGDQLLAEVYRLLLKEFVVWGKRRSLLNDQDLEDAFQDAVIVLFKKIKSGAVTSLQSSIKGFLMGIFKRKLFHKHRERCRFSLDQEIDDILLNAWDDAIYQKNEQEHLKGIFSAALEKIGDPCKTIFRLRFYENFALDAIAVRMDYKNEQVVSSQLYRCLERLHKLVEGYV